MVSGQKKRITVAPELDSGTIIKEWLNARKDEDKKPLERDGNGTSQGGTVLLNQDEVSSRTGRKQKVQICEPDQRETGVGPVSMDQSGYMIENSNQIDLDWVPRLPVLNGKFPALPLDIYDVAGARKQSPGRGAPMELRLFFAVVLSLQLKDRPKNGLSGKCAFYLSLRQLKDFAYPKSTFNRRRDIPRINKGLYKLRNLEIVLANGTLWQVVNVRCRFALDADLDASKGRFEVELPPGNHRGALIHKGTLFGYGKQSVIKFRGYLRLSYWWNRYLTFNGRLCRPDIPKMLRNGRNYLLDAKNQVITSKGKPVTMWNHPRAVEVGGRERNPAMDRLPELTQADLFYLFFQTESKCHIDKRARYKCRKLINAVIKEMEAEDVIQWEETCSGRFRLLPGSRMFK